MKVSRLSPRYADELLELADDAEATAETSRISPEADVWQLSHKLKQIAKDLRFMVRDNERFMNGEER